MNKAQREVAEYLLDKEERIIKQLERQYKQALADVEMDIRIMLMDEQTPSRIHRVEYQKRLKAQIESTLENLHRNEYKTINQFLQDSYTDSFVGTMYDLHYQGVPVIVPIDQNAAVKAIQLDTQLSDRKIHPNANGEHVTLYESLGVDVDNLKETIRLEITRGLATNMQPEYIAQNIANLTKAPLSRAKTIARTESHRIQQASAQDARQKAISKGAKVVKQWDATMDGATRKAHRQLDGQIVEVDERFTYGDLKAMYPGDFGDPAQDCNCRCVAVQRATWALGEEELETLKQRAEAFGLGEDKAKKRKFAQFEKKYLKAAEEVERAGKLDEVLTSQQKKVIEKHIEDAPAAVRKLFEDNKERVLFADAQSKEHPHFSIYEGGITIDVQKAIEEGNVGSVFHEIGHNIDSNMHVDRTYMKASGKYGKNLQDGYSYAYQRNKFGKVLTADADNALKEYERGIIAQHKMVEAEAKEWYASPKTQSFFEAFEMTKEERKDALASWIKERVREMGIPQIPKTRKDLEEAFSGYIKNTLAEKARGEISDMFEATFKHVEYPFGCGHGREYWKQLESLQSSEAFAEMFCASVAKPESWEQIQKYFPNAVKVFWEMIGG